MKKILIVEDDTFLVNAYRVKLEKSGHQVRIARDGREALEVVKEFEPEVILLDLVMPILDGFAVLKELQQWPSRKQMRIVVTSNLGQAEDKEKAMKMGADGYIVKTDTSLAEIVAMIE